MTCLYLFNSYLLRHQGIPCQCGPSRYCGSSAQRPEQIVSSRVREKQDNHDPITDAEGEIYRI